MDEISDKKRAFLIWKDYLKAHWIIYVLGFLSVVLTGLAQVLGIRILGWTLDFFNHQSIPFFLEGRQKQEIFWVLFFLLVASRLLLCLSRMGWRLTLARQTHQSAALLKSKIWQNVCFFKRRDLRSKYTKGILMNALTSDVNSARIIFGFGFIDLFDFIFLGFFTLAMMFTVHAPLALSSFGVLIFLPYLVKRLSELEIERYRKAQESLGFFNELSNQVVSSIRLQRLIQSGHYWQKRLTDSANIYRQKRLKAVQTSLFYIPIMGLPHILGYLVLFALGIHFVFQGSLSLGDFVAMQGLIFLLQEPLTAFGFTVSEWRKGSLSLERLSSIYGQPKNPFLFIQKDSSIDHSSPVLQVKDLSFQHKNAQEPLLEGVNLSIRRGDRLGILGPIGSGKSTLIDILSGLERDIQGSLKFHGKDFYQYKHQMLRGHIGFVRQKPFLFADSIRQNINLDQNFSDDEIWFFLEMADLAKEVAAFPEGLDTFLGEWGINISGGQKQRLSLARALARRPQLLFLDDCLSAVDTVTEEKILSNLNRELKEITIIWVAHRKSTLKYCHKVMELA